VRARIWGARGSVPVPRGEFSGYGGNTSCVQVLLDDERHVVALDAGTGITALGEHLAADVERVDVLMSHLHMDHILGLGFFAALYRPGLEVHLWGPSSTTLDVRARLTRYLSPPLFPVRLRELPCRLHLHDTPLGRFHLPGLAVDAALVAHPGPTVGYRLDDGSTTLAYLSDHEPALLTDDFPGQPRWTSGYGLAAGVDVLIHDAQYGDEQYPAHVGWGHSAIGHALSFAELCAVRHLVAFHHDPANDDATLDRLYAHLDDVDLPFGLTVAREGMVVA
jgi:phosphoribosyl 1,2-cyclic phosphodiesterase